MLRERWRLEAKEEKEEERGGGTDTWWLLWRLMVVLAGDGDANGGSRRRSFSLLSSSSLLFFLFLPLFFSLFFSFGLQLLSSSVLPLSLFLFFFRSSTSLLVLPFFLLSSPVFIGKTGEREAGAVIVQLPLHHPRDTSTPFSSTRGNFRQVGVLGWRLFDAF